MAGIIIGALIMLIGLVGSIWADNYHVSIEDSLDYLFDGKIPENLETVRFFKNYGLVLFVIGAVILVIGIIAYRKKMKADEEWRRDFQTRAYAPLDKKDVWRCPVCGAKNANYVGSCGCGYSKCSNLEFAREQGNQSFSSRTQKRPGENFTNNFWFCTKCGVKNPSDGKFCIRCGYRKYEPEE